MKIVYYDFKAMKEKEAVLKNALYIKINNMMIKEFPGGVKVSGNSEIDIKPLAANSITINEAK